MVPLTRSVKGERENPSSAGRHGGVAKRCREGSSAAASVFPLTHGGGFGMAAGTTNLAVVCRLYNLQGLRADV